MGPYQRQILKQECTFLKNTQKFQRLNIRNQDLQWKQKMSIFGLFAKLKKFAPGSSLKDPNDVHDLCIMPPPPFYGTAVHEKCV